MHATRAQLRSMLLSVGYEPVMSDQADVIYDPRVHTHTSCLREVMNCDVVILLVGSRFGGTIIPKALEAIDVDRLQDISRADRFNDEQSKISITQAEVLQAIQIGLPVFAFIDSGVMRDHLTYEKNKNKPIIKDIEFSSIDKPETAAYIFEFINFLRLRNENNSLFEFSRFEDIEVQLKKQWAGLFQRLLQEQRLKLSEGRRIDNLSSQIADLKAAVLGSISSGELKETAKGAIRFRQMVEFIYSLESAPEGGKIPQALFSQITWQELWESLGIVDQKFGTSRMRNMNETILIRKDGTYFRTRLPLSAIPRLAEEWNEFQALGKEAKEAIVNAILDSREGRPSLVRYYNEPFSSLDLEDQEIALESDPEKRAKSQAYSSLKRQIDNTLEFIFKTTPGLEDSKAKVIVSSDYIFLSIGSPNLLEEIRLATPYDAAADTIGDITQRISEKVKEFLPPVRPKSASEKKKG